MKLYFGTTSVETARIRRRGLQPSTSTGEVWFSRSLPVANARARQLCRHGRGRPMVAVCRLDVGAQKRRDGRVRCRGPMVAVRGPVAAEKIVEFLRVAEPPSSQAAVEAVLTSGEVFGLLDSPSPRVRMVGVMMLASQESAVAFDWLCTRLEDPDPRVRRVVAMALRRRGHVAADVLAELGADLDPMVRQAARQPIEQFAAI